ncbi:MAG: DUF1707 domain-containing protein [Micropruina sp.]|nr:MAG: DUF1707 domain-containing protein [Micropruina sp.]
MTIAPSPRPAIVGDAERSRLRAQLTEHYVAGRLSESQLVERLQAATSAQTAADVEQLTFDLRPLWDNFPAPAGSRATPSLRSSLAVAVDVLLGVLGAMALPCLFLLMILVGRSDLPVMFFTGLGVAAVTAAVVHFIHRAAARRP